MRFSKYMPYIATTLVLALLGGTLIGWITPESIEDSGWRSFAYLPPFAVERKRGEPLIFPSTSTVEVDYVLMDFSDEEALVNPLSVALIRPELAEKVPTIATIPQPEYEEPPFPTPTPAATKKPSSQSGSSRDSTYAFSGTREPSNGVTSSGKFSIGQVIDKVRVTHYCSCGKCNGYSNIGVTASGKHLTEGMCALNWLPLGSIVRVDGKDLIVEDRGVKEGQIDVYVDGGHSVALKRGKHYSPLTIIRIGRSGVVWDGAGVEGHTLDGLPGINQKSSSSGSTPKSTATPIPETTPSPVSPEMPEHDDPDAPANGFDTNIEGLIPYIPEE